MKFYRCNICGNLVELVNAGGGELVCCGEPMEELVSKTEEEGKEKHLPVVEKNGNELVVKVGSVTHPMTEAHYIQFIAVSYNNKILRAKLNYTDEPTATFVVDEDVKEFAVYEYCNIHGLWSTSYKA